MNHQLWYYIICGDNYEMLLLILIYSKLRKKPVNPSLNYKKIRNSEAALLFKTALST